MKALLLLLLVPFCLSGQSFEFSIEPESDTIIIDSVIVYYPESGTTFSTVGVTDFVIEEKATSMVENDVKTGMYIYPNPVKDQFNLVMDGDLKSARNFSIINVSGQIIYQSATFPLKSLTLNNLSEGLYVVNVSYENKLRSTSFLVKGGGSGQTKHLTVINHNNYFVEKSLKSAIPLPGPWHSGRPIVLDIFTRGFIHNSPYETVHPITPKEEDSGRTFTFVVYACTDDSGKHYPVVEVGDQTWMAKNLAMETDTGSWIYNDDDVIAEKYGILYSWEMAQEVCPEGWHLPTDDEWLDLATHLNTLTEDSLIADCLKYPEEWLMPVCKVPNVGFNALPAGAFYPLTEECYNLFSSAYFWTSDEAPDDITRGAMRKINETNAKLVASYSLKKYGFSVRCVKDLED